METSVRVLDEEVKKTLDLIMPSLNLGKKMQFHGGESDSLVSAEPETVHQVVANFVAYFPLKQ